MEISLGVQLKVMIILVRNMAPVSILMQVIALNEMLYEKSISVNRAAVQCSGSEVKVTDFINILETFSTRVRLKVSLRYGFVWFAF